MHEAKQETKKTNQRNSFRFAERCLFEFQANRARLEALQDERAFLYKVGSVKAQNYDPSHGGGYPSDAVSARLERLEKLDEEIRRLEGRVKPLERLLGDLESPCVLEDSPRKELLKIMQLYYFGENVWRAVAGELHLGRSAFFERRAWLVRLAIRYLGL